MVHGRMVCTKPAPRRQQFHVAPAMPALKYTTSVDIQKTRYEKLVTPLCVSCFFFFKRCFTSTETIRIIRDGKPGTATSTLTQLLNYVYID